MLSDCDWELIRKATEQAALNGFTRVIVDFQFGNLYTIESHFKMDRNQIVLAQNKKSLTQKSA